MLINLTELFSVDGKEKDYTCGIGYEPALQPARMHYDIVYTQPGTAACHVILGTKSFFSTGECRGNPADAM